MVEKIFLRNNFKFEIGIVNLGEIEMYCDSLIDLFFLYVFKII